MALSASMGASVPVIAVVDGIPTTTSVDVARHFGKVHRDVVRAIENLMAQLPPEGLRNFAHTPHTNEQNGETYNAYRLTRDGFTLLAMGFTGKKALAFKLAYIDAFNKMEAELRKPALDPERIKLAHSLAAEVAAVASRTVFEAVLADDGSWKHDRWMFCLNYSRSNECNVPWAKKIDPNAMVVSLAELPRRLLEPNGMLPSNKELANLAAACNQRLAQRLAYEVKQPGAAA